MDVTLNCAGPGHIRHSVSVAGPRALVPRTSAGRRPGYIPEMEPTGLEWLTSQLRTQPSPAVSTLADEDLRHLADAIRAARQHQHEQLQHASAQALDSVPRLLRGPIRKLVGG
jgi:hypothetical protein